MRHFNLVLIISYDVFLCIEIIVLNAHFAIYKTFPYFPKQRVMWIWHYLEYILVYGHFTT